MFRKLKNILFLILNLATLTQCQENCGTLARSTCPDGITSDWNKHFVGQNLKEWIVSINKIRSMPEKETEYFFLRKTVLEIESKNECDCATETWSGVQYIANIDCSKKTHDGPTWRKASVFSDTQFHDGFLYGIEDENGELTGKNIVYVYPDLETVLVGQFEKGKMVAARPSKIVSERCRYGIKEIKIAKPKYNAPILKYQRPDRVRIGDQPRVMDPYEKQNIYIGEGLKDDGVFAKRNISKGDLVCYYSGLIWNRAEHVAANYRTNKTTEEFYKEHRNLMSLGGNVQIDIPEPHWDIVNFRATLGHKMNHSFNKAKIAFGLAFHPRFGDIRSLYATHDITEGEEIFDNYGYSKGNAVPKWFSDLYFEETGMQWYQGSNNCGCQQ